MRSIIRFSVDGESNSALRNRLAIILGGYGYTLNPNVTATYEAPNISAQDLAAAMQDFWREAGSHKGPGTVDHVWLYADNPPSL